MVLSRPPLTYSNKASVSQEADTEGRQVTTLLAGTPLDQPLHDAPERLEALAQQITQIKRTAALLSQQLAARAAWDHQHLTTQARAEQLTAELSHRETMAIQRLAADPPAYLHNTLGTPPTHSSTARQAWLDAAQVIARYRIDTGVSDPSDPFGAVSTDPDEHADRQAAIEQVAHLSSALDRSPHRDRAPMEHRQEPPGPPPLGLL